MDQAPERTRFPRTLATAAAVFAAGDWEASLRFWEAVVLPVGIVAGLNGNVYVVEPFMNRVQPFTATGGYLRSSHLPVSMDPRSPARDEPPTFAAFRGNRDPAMRAILACGEHVPGA